MNSRHLENSPLQFPLNGGSIIIGRDSECDVVVTGAGVSRRHIEIVLHENQPEVRDLKSSFGIRVNGAPVDTALLNNGDCCVLGIVQLHIGLTNETITLTRLSDTIPSEVSGQQPAVMHPEKSEISIGRDPLSTIHCSHPLVSRHHAAVVHKESGCDLLIDKHSANGTFVNGRKIRQVQLDEDDIVQIGPFRFFYRNGILAKADDNNRVRIEAYDLTVRRGSATVLSQVSLTVQPGEFVVILGPSGAGKTTLGHALTGRLATAGGQVFMNGMPLKRFSAAYTSSVGFVAQQNLLHPELTVAETFREQALLRLPRDSIAAERYARVNEVLQLLDLASLSDRRVAGLSGGEAKRLHIGIELIASPPLIFLDEPLAGLDFGLIGRFMDLFKKISQKGHTVLLTTHTLEQIELADRIIFVNKGRVLYQGVPAGLITAFGVDSIAALYDKARTGELVAASAPSTDAAAIGRHDTPLPFIKPTASKGPSMVRQLGALTIRYTRILLRDRRSLALLLLQVPLICVLLLLVYRPDTNFLPISFYFCISVSAVWIGGVNGIREIAREWEIIDREVRAGLSLFAYASAKIFVFSMLSCVQGACFAFLLKVCFVHFEFQMAGLLLLVSASIGGTILGLAVSSLSVRVSVAVSWLPLLFIPQVFFSGILVPFDRMLGAGGFISHLTISRPVFSLFKRVYILNQSLWSMGEWWSLFALTAGLCILIMAGLLIHARSRH